MNELKRIGLLLLFSPILVLACDDIVPGALPPGRFGGIVEPFRDSKATLKNNDEKLTEETVKNDTKEEAQFFFEAIYRNKELRLYPLAIMPPKTALFTKLSPLRELTEIRAEVEFPWEGKTIEIPLTVTEEAVVAQIDAESVHRFIVHLRAIHAGKLKHVNLQLENGD